MDGDSRPALAAFLMMGGHSVPAWPSRFADFALEIKTLREVSSLQYF
jgi:hypothetical protein